MHVAQDKASDYELEHIMGVNNNIISSQANSPIMGCFQDSLIGSKIMTESLEIPREQFMDCVFEAGKKEYKTKYVNRFLDIKKRLGKKFTYSGKNLFSVVLPETFCYTKGDVVIKDGILLEGTIDKKTIGKSYYAIHHKLFKEYSKETASKFLSSVQRLINRFLIFNGFSIGISDFLSTEKFNMQVEEAVKKVQIEVSQIETSGESDKIKEFKINSCLNAAGSSLKLFGNDKNALELMIKTGAKGSPPNMKQIRAFLGQNTVEGKRIQPDIDNRSRTLPCFARGDISPITRGFIASCFLNGLSPEENWFHTMAGREGVINTAVKTQESGYAERKFVKRMENLVVENDYTVRNAGHIVSFVYGADNLNATWYLSGENSFVDVKSIVEDLGGSCISS